MMKHSKKNRVALLAMAAVMAAGSIGMTQYTASAAEAYGTPIYHTDFSTYEEEQAYANALNEDIAAEGSVLLKNENNALPLAAEATNVTVFGVGSVGWLFGGKGSGAGSAEIELTINDGLKDAGYNVNPKVEAYYQRRYDNGEANVTMPTATSTAQNPTVPVELDLTGIETVEGSYKWYNDAAIIVLMRDMGGYTDGAYYNVPDHTDPTDHELMLSDSEKEILAHVKAAGFEKIIYVINAVNQLELGDLERDPDVDAILWSGYTGSTGARAVGRILKGEVNPSGKTVDIYPEDLTRTPAYVNSSDGSHTGDHSVKNVMLDKDGNQLTMKVFSQGLSMIEYEEGIYVGYKWYETAAVEQPALWDYDGDGMKDAWDYDKEVVYPFGYGLSYTSFEQTLLETTVDQAIGGKTTVKVEVKNTGDVAGKDIVQVYWSPLDWEVGDIEKAQVNLVAFDKTDVLQPGETEIVEITFDTQDMASYDATQVHGEYKGAYVLEEGNYAVAIQSNSHDVIDSYEFEVAADIVYTTDADTGATIKNAFSNNDKYNTSRQAAWMADGESTLKTMTRGDFVGTYPTALETGDSALKFSDAFVKEAQWDVTQQTYYAYQDKTTDPWYVEEVPSTWKQATAEEVAARENGKTALQLGDMAGVAFDDAKWDTFLNQLTWEELILFINPGSFGGGDSSASDAIGRPAVSDADGPIQFSSGTFWVSAVNQAATWNVDLVEEHGELIGNESLFLGVNGWYGPAMNIHRSYFDGRAFEYYSEDGVLAGEMAAAAIIGAQSKGCNVFLKHFALNEQSTSRMGLVVWANEQSIREIYLKAFEAPIKAGASSIMTSFCCVGAVAAPANYALNVSLARDEWGFMGVAVTDMYMAYSVLLPGNALVRAYNYPLGSYSGTNVIEGKYDATKNCVLVAANAEEVAAGTTSVESATQWASVRNTAKAFLYICANSNQSGNNYQLSKLATSKMIRSIKGTEVEADVSIDTSKTGAYHVVYSSSDCASLGLTLSEDGTVSGTPIRSGSFTVTVTADQWVTADYSVMVMLQEPISTTSELTGEVGKEFSATFTALESVVAGLDEGSASYEVTGAPAGLTIDNNGVLSGTPTKAGTFQITVTLKGTETSGATRGGGSGDKGGSTETTVPVSYSSSFTLTITGEEAPAPVYVTVEDVQALIAGIDTLTEEEVKALIAAIDTMTEEEVKALIVAANDGLTEAEVNALIEAAMGQNPLNNVLESIGCSSVIGISAAASILALCGVAFVVSKKRED